MVKVYVVAVGDYKVLGSVAGGVGLIQDSVFLGGVQFRGLGDLGGVGWCGWW